MIGFTLVLFSSIIVTIFAINRPVYKIVLTQKGFAQFLQYDVETPPLREFTFCTWIRFYDLENAQSVFTYVANGNNRVMRVWLDSGGQHMKININGKLSSSSRVNVMKDVWRHICLSYQSDFGAWALYMDSRLVACEAAQSLYGFVFPSGGSIIVGYGTDITGAPNGLEGEVFGANMILVSTIERNYTRKQIPDLSQKKFKKNKLKKDTNNNSYIVLSDLLAYNTQNNNRENLRDAENSTKSFLRLTTPHIKINHNVRETHKEPSAEHEIFDFTTSDFRTTSKNKIDLWNIGKQVAFKENNTPNISDKHRITGELLDSGTKGVPTVSEYETPPPPSSYFDDSFKPHFTKSNNQIIDTTNNKVSPQVFDDKNNPELPDYETPPPPVQNNRVYGQWTSSKFAGTVLNYLKNIRIKSQEQNRKVPPTLPLHKISDTYPYSSDFKFSVIRPPSQFRRRKLMDRSDVVKRTPQINVQIFEDDIRSKILKTHAETQPKIVEITNRGISQNPNEKRFYRNADYYSDESTDTSEDVLGTFQISEPKLNNHRYTVAPTRNTKDSMLDYIRSTENFPEESKNADYQITVTDQNKDMYYKSFLAKNKWHNVKTYSNDFTPHKIIMDSRESEAIRKRYYPSLRLNYVHEKGKTTQVPYYDQYIRKARKQATEVPHKSNLEQQDSVSILKYNNGYLQTHDKIKLENMLSPPKKAPSAKRNMEQQNSFHKQVKLGNALNEHTVVGNNEEHKKQSFEGGNDDIPDINRYRSDIDNIEGKVPPSLGPRVCKNVELCDRVLYIQKDESIDMTHIVSPMRVKNIAIEFVMQNYKRCSLTDSIFQQNEYLMIDWNKTPVRLFGGAYPKTTTDLCGFF